MRRWVLVPMQGGRRFRVGKSVRGSREPMTRGTSVTSRDRTHTVEKSFADEDIRRPDRKPTQVGEASSLRCSIELRRRNSAK